MAFEVVEKLKCINKENFHLTVGEIYESVCSNSTKNSKDFMLFDDEGCLNTVSSDCFKIVKTIIRENTGWIIKCNDCKLEMTIDDIIKNNKKCPRCGQEFII